MNDCVHLLAADRPAPNMLLVSFIILAIISCAYSPLRCDGWSIVLDSHVKTCFFEDLNITDRIGVNYELDPEQGRQKHLDLEIYGPNGQLLLEARNEPFGTYYSKAVVDGRHYICFTSKGGAKVSFNILGGHPADANPASGQTEKDPTLEAMEQLKVGLRAVQEEQAYIIVRERAHTKSKLLPCI